MIGESTRGQRVSAEPSGGRGSGGRLSRRWLALAVAAAALLGTSCATTLPGEGSADPEQLSRYRSEQVASASAAQRERVVVLCRQSMTSMVVMVRGYNEFVTRLNTVHAYARVGNLDDRARASLIAGVDQIKATLDDSITAEVADPVAAFLASSTALSQAIGRKVLTGLNPLATTWTTDKQAVLAACDEYLPAPPEIAATTSAGVTTTPR